MNKNKSQAEQLPQDAVMQSVLAKDLRIGNYVEYEVSDSLEKIKIYWEVIKIDADDIHWLSKVDPNDKCFRAIPLTEEWLFKLGFINDRVLEFYRNDITDSTIIIDYNFICLLGYSHVKLKYVHELQNLYFALTGCELTVA